MSKPLKIELAFHKKTSLKLIKKQNPKGSVSIYFYFISLVPENFNSFGRHIK